MAPRVIAAPDRDAEVDNAFAPVASAPPERAPAASSLTPDWGLALGISTADFAARAFTPDPDSLKTIRRFIRETITQWGLSPFADDLITVVNELTTNAVQHALTPSSGSRSTAWLGIARTGNTVVCAVTDPSPTPPAYHHPESLAEAGRGLLIVNALTSQWGYAPTPSNGKAVWARISTPDR
ncbi:ATP-binding protein [Streptomyces sp. NPDC005374]|uniref:ATP-binding protein n=1 Tax=Streptomyces sp. NPDC005374 TaxID=3364713 RepID=UPI0036BBB072